MSYMVTQFTLSAACLKQRYVFRSILWSNNPFFKHVGCESHLLQCVHVSEFQVPFLEVRVHAISWGRSHLLLSTSIHCKLGICSRQFSLKIQSHHLPSNFFSFIG